MSFRKTIKFYMIVLSSFLCLLVHFGSTSIISFASTLTGWQSNETDRWFLYDSNGTPVTGWHGKYHFKSQDIANLGLMDYGWLNDNGNTYFLSTVRDTTFGTYVTGWQWIEGYCYYFSQEGVLIKNLPNDLDGNSTNEDGKWVVNGVVQYIEGKGLSSKVKEVQGYMPNTSEVTRVPEKPLDPSDISGNTNQNNVISHTSKPQGERTSSPLSNYKGSNTDVTTGTDTSGTHIIDVLIIQAKCGVTRGYIEDLVGRFNGKISDTFNSINSYVIKFSNVDTLDRLKEIKKLIQSDPNVSSVNFDTVYTTQ